MSLYTRPEQLLTEAATLPKVERSEAGGLGVVAG